MKIRCTTLFDITKTNISNRRRELDVDHHMSKERSQQSNFETLLQVISLRSQPEDISDPEKISINLGTDDRWGKMYKAKNKISAWTFSFTVNATMVFATNEHKLGHLLSDCNGVPMIMKLDEWERVHNLLTTEGNYRNVYFEIENE